MNIKLIKASKEYESQIIEMLKEWKEYNATHDTDHSPWAIFYEAKDFDAYMYFLNEVCLHPRDDKVPASTFFALDIDRNIMVGAINIRHYLNERLLIDGGHIGDGVRPSERRKGYATEIIRLGLIECSKLGINKVLMCCKKDNIGSKKSIINNGGVFDKEVTLPDEVIEHYWINLK